jgi:hypothetical protein
VLVKFL